MPHVTIEYSSNLDGRADIGALCRDVLRAALSTGVFETGAVRVRALRCEHYAIADEQPENAFVALRMRMAAGRTVETRRRVGEAIFTAARDSLAPLFDTPHFALSVDVAEIDPELNWKKNAMHARLRGG